MLVLLTFHPLLVLIVLLVIQMWFTNEPYKKKKKRIVFSWSITVVIFSFFLNDQRQRKLYRHKLCQNNNINPPLGAPDFVARLGALNPADLYF